jgi:hypothetical protein
MKPEHMKRAVLGVWALAWSVVALSINAISARGWIFLACAAVVPPLLLLRLWRPPAQTMSESIRDVLK